MIKLSSAQDAIKQAIEGGWKADIMAHPLAEYEVDNLNRIQGQTLGVWFRWGVRNGGALTNLSMELLEGEIFTDPLFWQALGKARGWENYYDGEKHHLHWKDMGVRWFETRMSGGDETKFWESLP